MTQGLQTTKTKETPNARKVKGTLIEEKIEMSNPHSYHFRRFQLKRSALPLMEEYPHEKEYQTQS